MSIEKLHNINGLGMGNFQKVTPKKINEIIDAVNAIIPSGAPLKYKALITQSGTNAPTVEVLENSLGSIVWTRGSAGYYVGTLAGVFTDGKTFTPPIGFGNGSGNPIPTQALTLLTNFNTNTVEIHTFSDNGVTSADDILQRSSILIEVYE